MTRDEVLAIAEKHAICTSEDHKEFLHDGLMEFASEISAAERRKHQSDIERWKGEAEKAEKWRALALSKDPAAAGRIVQEIQREAAEHERNVCINVLSTIEVGIFGNYDIARSKMDGIEECIEILQDRNNP